MSLSNPFSSFALGKTSTPMLELASFKGHVALVTGGGSGLGKTISLTLAHLGATVIIAGRRTHVIEATAKEINNSAIISSLESSIRGRVVPLNCDIRDEQSVSLLFEAIEKEVGKSSIDLLVNNAAGNFISPTERLNAKGFKAIIDSVLLGTINVTLCAAKRSISAALIEKSRFEKSTAADKSFQGLNIVNILATYAPEGSAYVVPSAVSKSGCYALTKSLAAEWGIKYGFRINAVSPGPIKTDGAFSRLDPTGRFEKIMLSRIPSKRLGEKEELANLVSYLLSPYSSWMTGQCIVLDGGDSLVERGMFNELKAVTEKEWDEMRKVTESVLKK